MKPCIAKQGPDVFGLCETFLNVKVMDRFIQITGYVLERKDRNKPGGGIICYIANDIKCKRRKNLEQKHFENIWIEVVNTCSPNILIGFVY